MIIKAWQKIVRLITTAVGKRKLRALHVKFGSGLVLYGIPVISVYPKSRIQIGDRVVFCSLSEHTALGVDHPVVLRTLSAGAELVIGDDVGISGGSICAAERVVIGAHTMLGANVTVADTDFHSLAPHKRRYNRDPNSIRTAEVIIEDNVFIGTNSVILKGVRIGRNSVIGAGSVVTKDIPANVIAAGNPCQVIRDLNNQATAGVRVPR